ncbi:MAG: hypothetical protein ACR2IE_04895 [Candidatus Sumerlaeaceae bacterium]
MEETFFEMLERTQAVDRLLFWLAVLSPPLIAAVAALLRHKPAVTRHRHRWVLACLVWPAVLVLWKVYNAVVDRFGLDSILGLFVNVGVFAAAAMLATGVRLVLRAALRDHGPVESTPIGQVQTAPEFRPYKPAFIPPDADREYSTKIASGENIAPQAKE